MSPLSCLVHLLPMQVQEFLRGLPSWVWSQRAVRCSLAALCSHRGWLAMLGLVTGEAGREWWMIAGGAPQGQTVQEHHCFL